MAQLQRPKANVTVLAVQSHHEARLNIGDRLAIDLLCHAFACGPEDVYVAVAMVGDRLPDVRAYLTRVLDREESHGPMLPALIEPLPPPWPTAS